MTGLLVKHFGFSSLKDWQLTIKAVLEGLNSFVVQPTGSGKSLCFQLPSLITGEMTVVITPTISLMKDQCCSLGEHGISATYLGSSQIDTEIDTKVKDGKYEIIYTTPEKFFDCNGSPSHVFKDLLEARCVGLIAIDEVHLVDSWKSFRYKNSVNCMSILYCWLWLSFDSLCPLLATISK